jgi:hypothetical protein
LPSVDVAVAAAAASVPVAVVVALAAATVVLVAAVVVAAVAGYPSQVVSPATPATAQRSACGCVYCQASGCSLYQAGVKG